MSNVYTLNDVTTEYENIESSNPPWGYAFAQYQMLTEPHLSFTEWFILGMVGAIALLLILIILL